MLATADASFFVGIFAYLFVQWYNSLIDQAFAPPFFITHPIWKPRSFWRAGLLVLAFFVDVANFAAVVQACSWYGCGGVYIAFAVDAGAKALAT